MYLSVTNKIFFGEIPLGLEKFCAKVMCEMEVCTRMCHFFLLQIVKNV